MLDSATLWARGNETAETISTMGGVVTPAQPLMVIVPRDNPLELEAFIENKDVGCVSVSRKWRARLRPLGPP